MRGEKLQAAVRDTDHGRAVDGCVLPLVNELTCVHPELGTIALEQHAFDSGICWARAVSGHADAASPARNPRHRIDETPSLRQAAYRDLGLNRNGVNLARLAV